MYHVLGAFMLAFCHYISSSVKNQIIAFFVYVFLMALIFLADPVSGLFGESPLFSLIFFLCVSLAAAIILFITLRKIILSVIFFAVLALTPTVIFFASRQLLEGAATKFVSAIAIFDIISYSSAGIFDIGSALMFINLTAFLVYLTIRSKERKTGEVVKNA